MCALWFCLRVIITLLIIAPVGFLDVFLIDDRRHLYWWLTFHVAGPGSVPSWLDACSIVVVVVLPYALLGLLVFAAVSRVLARPSTGPGAPLPEQPR